MREDEFIGGTFEWFTGEVISVSDPKTMNRVQVRAFGYYDKAITGDQLPWATVMMPNTSPSLKGVGMNHGLLVGSWVVGFFRDGPSAQDPIVMGSIASMTGGVIDIPVEAQVIANTNQVCTTIGGHLIEVDNALGDERMHVKHKSGSFMSFNSDGTMDMKHHTGSRLTFESDGSVSIIATNIKLNA